MGAWAGCFGIQSFSSFVAARGAVGWGCFVGGLAVVCIVLHAGLGRLIGWLPFAEVDLCLEFWP